MLFSLVISYWLYVILKLFKYPAYISMSLPSAVNVMNEMAGKKAKGLFFFFSISNAKLKCQISVVSKQLALVKLENLCDEKRLAYLNLGFCLNFKLNLTYSSIHSFHISPSGMVLCARYFCILWVWTSFSVKFLLLIGLPLFLWLFFFPTDYESRGICHLLHFSFCALILIAC